MLLYNFTLEDRNDTLVRIITYVPNTEKVFIHSFGIENMPCSNKYHLGSPFQLYFCFLPFASTVSRFWYLRISQLSWAIYWMKVCLSSPLDRFIWEKSIIDSELSIWVWRERGNFYYSINVIFFYSILKLFGIEWSCTKNI